MRPPSLKQCCAMLSLIPANERDAWVRIGMALHSEYHGDDGFAAFDQWSKRGESYDAKNVRAVWKSFKPGGGVSIGTLIDEAKRHGYTFDKDDTPAPALSPEQIEAQQRERAEREAKAKRAIDSQHESARRKAETALHAASDSGESAYLIRKKINVHGVKFERDGALLVPIRDEAGELWNVQRIDANGEKKFLHGGRKSGLWHWIGTPPTDLTTSAPLLIAEGYATAASVYEATGYPCAVAFDCGNLIHVAKAIRSRYPNAIVVLCADDDANARDEHGKPKHTNGSNPGVTKAKIAAKAVSGRVAIPCGLREGDTDFNDLAISASAEAVKAIIDRALTDDTSGANGRAKVKGDSTETDDDSDDQFTIDERGVWTTGYDRNSKKSFLVYVCPPLRVRYRTRTSEGTEWGRLLEFNDPQGQPKTWVLPSRMLAGDGTEYRAQLASLGFEPPQGLNERRHLTAYITSRRCETVARAVKRIGWHDDRRAFVLPCEVIQANATDEPFILQIDGESDMGFRSRGTLDSWRENVASLAVGNSRLTFAISCAFAGTLLEAAQQMGGGWNLRGSSSEGKTSALRMGASVWGGPSFTQTWRATDSALEWVCASRCDTFLPLDELKEIEATKIGACAYMIANGVGKARSNQGGANRVRHEWRVLFLSTGEISVQDHIRDGGGKAHAGQEVRVPDIPSNAGKGYGLFESLHGEADGKAFAQRLNEVTREHYGTAGAAFVRGLFEAHGNQLGDYVRSEVRRIAAEFAPAGSFEQVQRVADRFALVAVAGEMATRMGLTGWSDGEAERAALACFADWLIARGGNENREEMDIVRNIRRDIVKHGSGAFEWERRSARGDDHAPKIVDRHGWKRLVDSTGEPSLTTEKSDDHNDARAFEYLIPVDTFKAKYLNGHDYELVATVLRDKGITKTESGRLTSRQRIAGEGTSKVPCIVIRGDRLFVDSESDDTVEPRDSPA